MKELEKEIKKYLEERDWHKALPGDYAKSIAIEAAELLEIFQWSSLAVEEVKKDKEKLNNLKKELADVLIYALDMSVLFDFDAEKLIKEKLRYNRKKFPVTLLKKDRKNYFKIKKEYRKKGL